MSISTKMRYYNPQKPKLRGVGHTSQFGSSRDLFQFSKSFQNQQKCQKHPYHTKRKHSPANAHCQQQQQLGTAAMLPPTNTVWHHCHAATRLDHHHMTRLNNTNVTHRWWWQMTTRGWVGAMAGGETWWQWATFFCSPRFCAHDHPFPSFAHVAR